MKSFASFQPERPQEGSAIDMTKIVRKTLSEVRLSAKQKRRLKKLAHRPEKFWRNAVRNPFYRPMKKQLTLRLDADVIAWLRRQGKGYQTRANALLRAAMLEEVKEKVS